MENVKEDEEDKKENMKDCVEGNEWKQEERGRQKEKMKG